VYAFDLGLAGLVLKGGVAIEVVHQCLETTRLPFQAFVRDRRILVLLLLLPLLDLRVALLTNLIQTAVYRSRCLPSQQLVVRPILTL
jgi:hypothetical protein